MSFRLDLINRAGLFRNYASWHETESNWHDRGHLNMAHSLSSIICALERMHLLKNECIDQYISFSNNYKWPANEILFRSPSLFDLFSTYSTYLLSLRLAQNSLLIILGKELKIQTPQSMSGVIDWKRKNTIPKGIYDRLKSYWEESGLELKRYRDIDQHYGLVTRDAWIVKKQEIIKLEIYLPDNPAIQSDSKFTYDLKRDAFAYAASSFKAFHELMNDISIILGYGTERDFDYNMTVPFSHGVAVYLTSDPFKKKLCAKEIKISGESAEYVIHESFRNFDNYDFLKINEYFPVKHSFYKEQPFSGEFDFTTENNE